MNENEVKKQHPQSRRRYKPTHKDYYISTGSTRKHVCFTCRKCFHSAGHSSLTKCNICAGQTFDCGVYFRAPKKSDIKQWAILEVMVRENATYFSKHGTYMPESVAEAREIGRVKRLTNAAKIGPFGSKKDRLIHKLIINFEKGQNG